MAPSAMIRGEKSKITNEAAAKVREEEEERKKERKKEEKGRKRAGGLMVGQSRRMDWHDLVAPCQMACFSRSCTMCTGTTHAYTAPHRRPGTCQPPE
jgi:hypothetical protein